MGLLLRCFSKVLAFSARGALGCNMDDGVIPLSRRSGDEPGTEKAFLCLNGARFGICQKRERGRGRNENKTRIGLVARCGRRVPCMMELMQRLRGKGSYGVVIVDGFSF